MLRELLCVNALLKFVRCSVLNIRCSLLSCIFLHSLRPVARTPSRSAECVLPSVPAIHNRPHMGGLSPASKVLEPLIWPRSSKPSKVPAPQKVAGTAIPRTSRLWLSPGPPAAALLVDDDGASSCRRFQRRRRLRPGPCLGLCRRRRRRPGSRLGLCRRFRIVLCFLPPSLPLDQCPPQGTSLHLPYSEPPAEEEAAPEPPEEEEAAPAAAVSVLGRFAAAPAAATATTFGLAPAKLFFSLLLCMPAWLAPSSRHC